MMANRSSAARSLSASSSEAYEVLRADIEAVLAKHEDHQNRIEQLASCVRRVAAGVPGLREAYVSQQADEVIFVGDDWVSLSDKVSELLDSIGTNLDPSGETFIRGGLHLGNEGLDGYTQVALG